MPLTYRIGEEPLPGFRLKRYLGDGTFGAVWSAAAPGGTEVAIKFIDLRDARGNKELKSLQVIKRLRHPNLVPLLGYWLKDEQGRLIDTVRDTRLGDTSLTDTDACEAPAPSAAELHRTIRPEDLESEREPAELIVVMGLGDMSLSDRLRAAQAQGQAGIEISELLQYVEDVARGIDYLNASRHVLNGETVAIQHCDIKPQNLLIVGGAAQICDLGLARIVDDTRRTRMSFTAAYGAPECFRGSHPSPWTDQYSLAISYVELRTGRLPFTDQSSPATVIQQHLDNRLDLSALPVGEQLVIRKATSLVPTERYRTALAMVEDLRRATSSDDVTRLSAVQPRRRTWPLTIGLCLLVAVAAAAVMGRQSLRQFVAQMPTPVESNSIAPAVAPRPTAPASHATATAAADNQSAQLGTPVAASTAAKTASAEQTASAAPVAASPLAHSLAEEAPSVDVPSQAHVAVATNGVAAEPVATTFDAAASTATADAAPPTDTRGDRPLDVEPAAAVERISDQRACQLVQQQIAKCWPTFLASARAVQATETLRHRALGRAMARVETAYTEGWVILARAALNRHDVTEADASLSRALTLNPNSSTAHVQEGRKFAQQNQLEEAVRCYALAIKLDPTNAEAYALRGVARALTQQVYLAHADLSEAIRLRADDARALRMRALVSLRLGRYADAVRDRDTLAELPVDDTRVILPLQVAGSELTVPADATHATPIVLRNHHPLRLLAVEGNQLVVDFQYEGQRYETRLAPSQVRPNARF